MCNTNCIDLSFKVDNANKFAKFHYIFSEEKKKKKNDIVCPSVLRQFFILRRVTVAAGVHPSNDRVETGR